MTPLTLQKLDHVVCLGAHSDDLEIGAGCTVRKLIEQFPDVHVDWVVFSAADDRRTEAQLSAEFWLRDAGSVSLHLFSFRDRYFPSQWEDIKNTLHGLPLQGVPDLVLSHRRQDRHQDHQLIAELTWNAFRNSAVLEYEIPKYEGDLGQPNLYVEATAAAVDEKVDALHRYFPTQSGKPWFDPDTFRGLMRLRGLECNALSGYAEAFHATKLTLF